MGQDARGEKRSNSGNVESASSDTVAEEATKEVELDMPLAAQQDEDRQAPRSGEGEGSTGDTANGMGSGQSASEAPKQGE